MGTKAESKRAATPPKAPFDSSATTSPVAAQASGDTGAAAGASDVPPPADSTWIGESTHYDPFAW